ncbi:DsbA family protein [Methyloceanibacter methanicus]|uniref:DsbA family protein n=1 Tax=Methyloceanibacter methanicus TaxID=1774968 RepID=UPI0013015999|nr:DsbA family protein [Methyloceanibacter methanicus]
MSGAVLCLAAFGLAACGAGGSAPEAALLKDQLLEPGPLGEREYGNRNAPVTIIEYVSLTCPYCRAYHAKVFPRVKRTYVDTGRVRYIIREFAIGQTAGAAAIVTRCAPKSQYLPLIEAYLSRQREWVSQDVRKDALYKIAKTSGMSRAQFDKCLSNQSIIDGLTEVKQRGRKFGVVGTPTFFINGQKLQGEVTFEQIKALIEPQAS